MHLYSSGQKKHRKTDIELINFYDLCTVPGLKQIRFIYVLKTVYQAESFFK